MPSVYVVTGVLTDGRTVALDEALPTTAGRVRLTVELVEPEKKPSFFEVMEQIWEGQRQRGYVPPTAEEVDAYIQAEREGWND